MLKPGLLRIIASAAIAASFVAYALPAAGKNPAISVEVVHPKRGGGQRTTTVPGSLIADQSARLFAKVSGYLQKQNVDIGDEVKAGDILAVIDVPELAKEVERNAAAFEQAQAQVLQTKAQLATAQADRQSAEAQVGIAQSGLEDAEAMLTFRQQIFERMQKLVTERAIEPKVAEEKEEEYRAAKAALNEAKAEIRSADASVASAEAKIQLATANIKNAEANVHVTRATWERSQVLLDFATIRAPFDGVITERNFFAGDFISEADGRPLLPLLSLKAVKRLRAVVQVPDRDVPYANPGDPAVLEIDALPGRRFEAKISRVAKFESPDTRTMRAEIDVENKDDELRVGMYGKATLYLETDAKTLLLSSQCLIERGQKGKAAVYVVRDGKARKVIVRVGADNGVDTEIVSGLAESDSVVLRPNSALSDGEKVNVRERRTNN